MMQRCGAAEVARASGPQPKVVNTSETIQRSDLRPPGERKHTKSELGNEEEAAIMYHAALFLLLLLFACVVKERSRGW